MEYCVGIDLGTTNTLCAIWTRGEPEPRLLPILQPTNSWLRDDWQRAEMLPSVVAVRPEGVFVGTAARESASGGQENMIFRSIKLQMGERWSERAGGRQWSAPQLSGCILKAVANELAAFSEEPPLQIVITVPASFDTEARQATLTAAALAGFDPDRTRIFDEPSSALLHEIHRPGAVIRETQGKLLIVDVGGGTLDVSLLSVENHGAAPLVDILGRSRYHDDVAGDAFDRHIAGLLLARFEKETAQRVEDVSAASFFSELMAQAEAVKCRLSERAYLLENQRGRPLERADFAALRERVTCYRTPKGEAWSTELDLNDLGEALRFFFPFLKGSNDAAARQEWRADGRFFKPIQECLDSVREITGSDQPIEEINGVYLAGGSALLPMISSAVQRIVHQRPRLVNRPMQAVALGAAWFAGLLNGFGSAQPIIRERLYDGIYLQTASGKFAELLSPREPIPVAERRFENRLSMAQADRRLEVQLFTGSNENDPNMQPLARRRVDFGRLLPEGHPIDLVISVDENRRVRFKFRTIYDGSETTGQIEISAAIGWIEENDRGASLPPVNQLPA